MVSNLNLSCFSSKYSSTIILISPEHRLLVMFSCHPQSRRAFSASLPVTPGCDVHVPWPLAAVCACSTPLRHPQIISPNSTFLPSPFSRSHFHPPSPPSSPSRKVWPAPRAVPSRQEIQPHAPVPSGSSSCSLPSIRHAVRRLRQDPMPMGRGLHQANRLKLSCQIRGHCMQMVSR